MNIVAMTSCPTGIAHTLSAAEGNRFSRDVLRRKESIISRAKVAELMKEISVQEFREGETI